MGVYVASTLATEPSSHQHALGIKRKYYYAGKENVEFFVLVSFDVCTFSIAVIKFMTSLSHSLKVQSMMTGNALW